MNKEESEYMISEVKKRILNTKEKISEMDIIISKLSSLDDMVEPEDIHIPTEGLPYQYGAYGSDNTPGIKIPGGQPNSPATFTLNPATGLLEGDPSRGSVFSGYIRLESDSTFICQDILGVEECDFPDIGDVGTSLGFPPAPGRYVKSLSNTFQSVRKITAPFIGTQGIADETIGHDVAFRLIDEGTGRNLFAVDDSSNQKDVFIPGRAIRSGLPWSSFGPNYKHPLSADHVFSKNALIRVDVIVYEPADYLDVRLDPGLVGTRVDYNTTVFISLLGYKVYGE